MHSALAGLRKAAGLTQQQVADHFGIVRTAVTRWETGKAVPRSAMLSQLATLYSCRIEDLLEGNPNDNPVETA